MSPNEALLVFDVNETLLATHSLRPWFQRVFGDESFLECWFQQVLLYAETATLAGPYVEFNTLTRLSLESLAEASGLKLTEADRDALLEQLKHLPPYPEVPTALEQLRSAGFRLVAFSNSPPESLHAHLKNAGIARFFERALSVHELEKYKPAPATYEYAAHQLAVPLSAMLLIAAHPWDVIGALEAGCQAAFLQRSGKAWFHLRKPPELVAADLNELATRLTGENSAAKP